MLKKLMCYDFKSIFKLWGIAALSTVALSLIGGSISTFFTANMFTEKEIPTPILIVAVIILVMVLLGFVAFAIFSEILVYFRFYKNLYTDEGYLTFTLPAKRQSILNSKIFLGFATISLTTIVLSINSVIMFVIAFGKYAFTKEALKELAETIKDFIEYEYSYFAIIYIIEALILLALVTLVSVLFAYACITIASVIAKKAKILVAVGIYYGATSIISSIFSIFYLFGITSLYDVFWHLDQSDVFICVALLIGMVILIMGAFCCLLYHLTHWCLHKKLNLA